MRRRWSLALLLAILGATSARAHHSFAMFDLDKDITFVGTVVVFVWGNPHSHLTVVVKPGPGVDPATVGTWDIEGGSTNIMGRQGWTRATYKAGDPITLVGHPMKDGSKGVSLFYAVKNGKRLYHDIARPQAEP